MENHDRDSVEKGNIDLEAGENKAAMLREDELEQGEASVIDEMAELRQIVEKQQDENRKLYDQYLRALAEAENTRKRMTREREEYIKFAALPLLRKLLPVVDDLERALLAADSSRDYEALSKGVEMITRRMQDIIREQDVVAIEAHGQPFDPQYHQALAVEDSAEHPENTVMEELQKGYMMHGRVIRPSLVKVSN